MINQKQKIFKTYIDGKYGQIHLRVAANNSNKTRPLLCIHLSPLSGIVYENFLKHISNKRRVIAPDTPGYGMSDSPPYPPKISDYANVMIKLIENIGFNKVDIIGYGTGSKIAFQMGLEKPDKIKHVLLISAPDYTEKEIEIMNDKLGKIIEPEDDGSHLIKLWEQVKSFPENQERMRVFPDHIKSGERKPWGPRAAFSYSYKDNLKKFKPKLLVLNIDNEITMQTKRLSKFLSNEEYIERLDWKHGFLDKHTKEFSEIVSKFTDN